MNLFAVATTRPMAIRVKPKTMVSQLTQMANALKNQQIMKINLVATAFFLVFAAQLKAQHDDYSDKVYLNNGSHIVGKIIFYQPNDTLKVQVAGEQILHFPPEQVKKIRMSSPSQKNANRAEKLYHFRERGFYDALSFAVNLGRSSQAHQGTGFQNVVGYQFHRLVGGGIGVGYDSYYIKNGESNVLSVFGEYRGYLSQRNISEYWTIAAGYGQPSSIKNDYLTHLKGSFMVQPTVGFRFGASNRYNFFADAGFRLQQIRFENNNEWTQNHYTVTYRRWILRGGILF